MRIRRPSRRNAHTFLIHVFGRGLDGERYVIERFRSALMRTSNSAPRRRAASAENVPCRPTVTRRAPPGPLPWTRYTFVPEG